MTNIMLNYYISPSLLCMMSRKYATKIGKGTGTSVIGRINTGDILYYIDQVQLIFKFSDCDQQNVREKIGCIYSGTKTN